LDSIALLDRLVAFPTVSDRSNLSLIDFVRSFLADRGMQPILVGNAEGTKANLFVTIGPADRPGILMSGHTDVVPVAGQTWTSDPFALTERDGRLYGRGATDMKGFVACLLRAADLASSRDLSAPLHIALSHDEEIGCVGVRSLLNVLQSSAMRARCCIVGEPTSMAVALGHKGKLAARAVCRGAGGHSALAPQSLNAIHLATDFVGCLRRSQRLLENGATRDDAYDIPYTTIHAGMIGGGTALNLVPESAVIDFEIRAIAADDPDLILDGLRQDAADLAAAQRQRFPNAAIEIEVVNAYPGLDTPMNSEAVSVVRELLADAQLTKVAFGTEGGLFEQRLGVPTVVCGPGSMAQGHIADEFISREQIAACDAMMDRLVESLTA
jgi:acetylornithine deacetylase